MSEKGIGTINLSHPEKETGSGIVEKEKVRVNQVVPWKSIPWKIMQINQTRLGVENMKL